MTEETKEAIRKAAADRRENRSIRTLEAGDFRITSDDYNLILEKKNDSGSWVHQGYYGSIDSLVHAMGKKVFMHNFPDLLKISQQLKELDGKVKNIVAMFGNR